MTLDQVTQTLDRDNGMLETIHHTLETQPVLLIFLVIALGYLIGGIRFGSLILIFD